MKLKELADRLNCQYVGDPELEIAGLATIEAAQSDQLTFLSNKKYVRHLAVTQAAAVILEDATLLPDGRSGLISSNPYLSFAEAMWIFHPAEPAMAGIHPLAVISPTAKLGEKVSIGALTVIGEGVEIGDRVSIHSHCAIYPNARIGSDVLIHSHCVIREGCRLGAKVILQNNVVIGSDGFGYAKTSTNSWFKIPQAGIVIIEDEVEIGAGSAIDRATIGATVVGNEVILSGQVGAAGHLEIGDRVIATAQTGIPNSVEAGKVISGYPAIDNRDWLKSSAVFAELPKLRKEIRELRNLLNQLEAIPEK